MSDPVDISFDCLPLRSVARFGVSPDDPAELMEFARKIRQAVNKHGQFNTYYLHNAHCAFHLTKRRQRGYGRFSL